MKKSAESAIIIALLFILVSYHQKEGSAMYYVSVAGSAVWFISAIIRTFIKNK